MMFNQCAKQSRSTLHIARSSAFYDVIGLFEQLRRDSRMSFALGRAKEDNGEVNGED